MLTAEQRKVLFIHLVRDPNTIRAAVDKLTDDLFDRQAEALDLSIWMASKVCFARHSAVAPSRVFAAELGRILRDNFAEVEFDVYVLATVVKEIYDYPAEQLSYVGVAEWLRELLSQRKLAPIMHAAAAGRLTHQELLTRLEGVARGITVSSTQAEDLSSFGLDVFFDTTRTMTGHRPTDKLLGGIRSGETIALLGPMKGGKTSYMHSLVADYVRTSPQHKATFVTYEEPALKQVPKLLLASMNRYRFDDLRGKKFNDMPPRMQSDLKIAHTVVSERVAMVDMAGSRAQGSGGAPELTQALTTLNEQGKLGQLVVIDHLLPMVQKSMASDGVDASNMRHQITDTVRAIVDTIGSLGVSCLIAHQLDAAGNKDPLRKPTHMDSSECKLFGQYFHDVMCLGVRNNEDNIAWLNLSCSRTAEPNAIHVLVAGWKSRVDCADGIVEDERTHSFVTVDESRLGRKVPRSGDQSGPMEVSD